jgi:hypothetical protein
MGQSIHGTINCTAAKVLSEKRSGEYEQNA